jgi:hypothetical protein
MTPKVVAPAAGKHLTRLPSVFLFSNGIKQNDILLIPRECVTGAAKMVFSRPQNLCGAMMNRDIFALPNRRRRDL